jgi:hypothetical protein
MFARFQILEKPGRANTIPSAIISMSKSYYVALMTLPSVGRMTLRRLALILLILYALLTVWSILGRPFNIALAMVHPAGHMVYVGGNDPFL